MFSIYEFIYFGLQCIFIALPGLSLVSASGGYSLLWCMGFSLGWLLLGQSTVSGCTGFSSCETQAKLFRGMWNLLGPGIKPRPPVLAGRFLSSAPPRKSEVFAVHRKIGKSYQEYTTNV